jgi:hypothetical protein
MQTNLEEAQTSFLEEIAGLISALNRQMTEAMEINHKNTAILVTLSRIEDKLDIIANNQLITERIRKP